MYYWKKGSDFVKYAEQMISKNVRVNNEFYVCPAYNEAIQDNKHIACYMIEKDAMCLLSCIASLYTGQT